MRNNVLASHVKLGSVRGIKIGLHYSWFLIALLIVLSFSQNFHLEFPRLSPLQLGMLSGIAAILFFASLLLHELSHSLVAKSRNIEVREITLFALGGVSQMEGESGKAEDEFWIAAAGPLASVAIGIALIAAIAVTGGAQDNPVKALLNSLGYINLALAGFNLIPGYPLDGGRILRALLWWKSRNMEQATRTAARVGQAVGTGFVVLGILGFFSGSGFGGLWIAFIGWFLVQAASASYLEVGLKRALSGVRVADVMNRRCPTVDGASTLQDLVDSQLLPTGRRCFVVVDQGRVAGLITAREISAVDRSRWPVNTVEQAMKPLAGLKTVSPADSLAGALEILGKQDINQLPVVEDGVLEGVLSRADVLAYLQTLMEFRAA